MNNLAIKEVDFNGDTLMACEKDEKIYVGVKWVCQGIGLSEGQIKSERKKIQEDIVLKQGGRNFVLPTNSGKQDTLCIELEFLPLWLAKISITPKMQKDNPFLVAKLVDYQLKAKDVLAKAFIDNNQLSSNLMFLQGILDGMKESELRVKKLEEQSSFTNNKVIHLETEFNKETVTEGYKTNDNIARSLALYSTKNKPHFGFVDAVAKYLRIYNTTIGYKDEYVNVVRTTVHGGSVGVAVYYSDKAIEMIYNYLTDEFKPSAIYYKRGVKKDAFNEAAFELNNKTYKFNENTYKKYNYFI